MSKNSSTLAELQPTAAALRTTVPGLQPTAAALRTTVAELKAMVAELGARIQTLEEQAAQRHPEVSEEVLLAISAACAAYLGKRGTIKQVHLRRGAGWAAQGRVAAQQSHSELHGYGERQAPLTQIPRRGTT